MEHKTAKLELKELNEDGTFEGYAAVYNIEDLGGDIIDPGAFKRSIALRQGKVPILASHDPTQEIGVAEVQEDAKGIHVAVGRLYLSTDKDDEIPAARSAYILMKRRQTAGMPLGMSIGYETVDHRFSGTIRHIKEAKLWEVSTCTFPMNPMAGVTAVKERPGMEKPTAQHKAQTFSQVLQSRDIMEQRYDIDCAFWRSLWSVLEDENMTAEQKIAMTQVSLQQFSEALMTWVRLAVNMSDGEAVEYMSAGRYAPQLASLVAEAKVAFAKHDTKAGAVFSARNRSTIQSCVDQLQALLAIVAAAQEEDSAKSHAPSPATKEDAPATQDPSDPEAVLHAEDGDVDLSEADMAQLLATIQSMGSTA